MTYENEKCAGMSPNSFVSKVRGSLHILVPWLLLACVSCQQEPPTKQSAVSNGTAPGSIVISVISSTSSTKYWRYRVRPSSGDVVRTEQGQVADRWLASRFATGHSDCFEGVQGSSPNQQLVAKCSKQFPGAPAQFKVAQADSGTIVFEWQPQGLRGIDGFVWSPNSRSVALLNHSERNGKGPLELLWAGAGHPVPHDTYYLDLVDVQSGKVTEYVVKRDVTMGQATILDWSE